MLTVVIVLIVLAVAIGIAKDYNKLKAKQNYPPSKTSNTDVTHRIEKRHKRLMIRGARLDRHRRIWSVLYLVNSFHEVEERLGRGAYVKRAIQNLESAKGHVLEYKPTDNDIKIAIRFCQMEHVRGKCLHRLTPSDIETITNIYTIAQLPPYNRP